MKFAVVSILLIAAFVGVTRAAGTCTQCMRDCGVRDCFQSKCDEPVVDQCIKTNCVNPSSTVCSKVCVRCSQDCQGIYECAEACSHVCMDWSNGQEWSPLLIAGDVETNPGHGVNKFVKSEHNNDITFLWYLTSTLKSQKCQNLVCVNILKRYWFAWHTCI